MLDALVPDSVRFLRSDVDRGGQRALKVDVEVLVDDPPHRTWASIRDLLEQARGLMHGERDRVANAANLSSLVYHALPGFNWVGFYFFDGTELVIGPFQGKPACVRIPLDRGVCGAAARTATTQRVDDALPCPTTSPATPRAGPNSSCR